MDMEWLLTRSAGVVRRAISGTALEHAGVTQLRKNAVVLLKKRSEDARSAALLDWVRKNTGSPLIRRQIDLW
jgi:hypothetical protein